MRRHEGVDEEAGPPPAQERVPLVRDAEPRRPGHASRVERRPFGGRLKLLGAGLVLVVLTGVLRLLPHMFSDPIDKSKHGLEARFPNDMVERERQRVVAVLPLPVPRPNASTAANAAQAPVALSSPGAGPSANGTARDEEDYGAFSQNEGGSILIPSAAQCDATRAMCAHTLPPPHFPRRLLRALAPRPFRTPPPSHPTGLPPAPPSWVLAGCQFHPTSLASVGLRMLSSSISATAASAHTGEPPFGGDAAAAWTLLAAGIRLYLDAKCNTTIPLTATRQFAGAGAPRTAPPWGSSAACAGLLTNPCSQQPRLLTPLLSLARRD